MTTKTIDVHEAQTRLPELVSSVETGAEIILTKDNTSCKSIRLRWCGKQPWFQLARPPMNCIVKRRFSSSCSPSK